MLLLGGEREREKEGNEYNSSCRRSRTAHTNTLMVIIDVEEREGMARMSEEKAED